MKEVGGGPHKKYMVSQLTKGVSEIDAIELLIDNAIDSAEAHNLFNNCDFIGKIDIDINVREGYIKVTDNCGGFDKNKILGGALVIGSAAVDYKSSCIIRHQNLGLKKSIVRLSEKADIISNNLEYPFKVIMDIDNWGEGNWNHAIERICFDENNYEGVEVKIYDLKKSVLETISKINFISDIRNRLALKYRYNISSRLNININDRPIEKREITGKKVASRVYKRDSLIDVEINLYNNINLEEEEPGIDLFINDRIVVNRSKSVECGWKRLNKSGYSYAKCLIEIKVYSNNKEIPEKDIIEIISTGVDFAKDNGNLFKALTSSIQFEKEVYKIKNLMDEFSVTTNKEVGSQCFDKVYEAYISR